MSTFDYPYAYEDRNDEHTSRWVLEGVRTGLEGANIAYGRLWFTAVDSSNTVTVTVYKDPDESSEVASGTADISSIDDAPAKCTLTASNDSGLTGEFFFESYTSDPAAPVEVLVSLAMDSDLEDEHQNIARLPAFNDTEGMARWLAVATRKTLLQVGQVYRDSLGGFGTPESRFRTGAERLVPDFRAISQPDQLREAAVHWALMLAFGSSHERGTVNTMYKELRDYHDERRQAAIQGWNLAINTTPSSDDDADKQASANSVSITRL